jgi:hypothetical protein
MKSIISQRKRYAAKDDSEDFDSKMCQHTGESQSEELKTACQIFPRVEAVNAKQAEEPEE